jgi:hypothetical protein
MIIAYYNNIAYLVNSGDIKWHELYRDNDLPVVIWSNGTDTWFIGENLHRDNDKPAKIWLNGTKEWFKNGKRHREGNNPAIIFNNGRKEWYKNDKHYNNFKLNYLFFLQSLIKILFHIKFNKILWSPKYIAGNFTKKQLLVMLLPKVALSNEAYASRQY